MLEKSKLGITAIAIAGAMMFAGCGSSTGGGSDGDVSNAPSEGLPPINAVEAAPTAANGAEATETVVYMGDVSDIGILAASEEKRSGFDSLKFASLQQKMLVTSLNEQTPALNEAISETTQCSGGGTISVTGSETETSMDMTMTAANCVEEGMTMHGSIHIAATGTNYGETISSWNITFPQDYTVTYDASTFKIHQGSYMDFDYSVYTDYNNFAGTYKSSLWFELTDTTPIEARYDDLTVKFSYSSSGSEQCYKAGRIYIKNITEYLDIDQTYDPNCDYPFVIDNYYNLLSGSLEYSVSDGRQVHVEITAPNEITVTDDESGEEVIAIDY